MKKSISRCISIAQAVLTSCSKASLEVFAVGGANVSGGSSSSKTKTAETSVSTEHCILVGIIDVSSGGFRVEFCG